MLENNQKIKLGLFVCLLLCLPVYSVAADLSANRYIIGSGDTLDVSVWKNEDLTKLVKVLPDGFISFPLVGEVKAVGKTVSQFKKDLEAKLVQFVPQPSLSVIANTVNMKIYIIGKVKNPGMYSLNENTNVLQALTMASGLNAFAKRNEIKILRKVNDKTRIYEFIYDDVSSGSNLDQNIIVMRGDIIVVP